MSHHSVASANNEERADCNNRSDGTEVDWGLAKGKCKFGGIAGREPLFAGVCILPSMWHDSSCWTVPVLPRRTVWGGAAEVKGGLADIWEPRLIVDDLQEDPSLLSQLAWHEDVKALHHAFSSSFSYAEEQKRQTAPHHLDSAQGLRLHAVDSDQ